MIFYPKDKYIALLIILSISFIFPLIGFLLTSLYIASGKVGKFELRILVPLFSIGMGIMAFLYDPNGVTIGDVVNYHYSFQLFYIKDIITQDINNSYLNYFYNSIFYLLTFILKSIGLNSQYLSFIYVSLIYFLFLNVSRKLFDSFKIKYSYFSLVIIFFIFFYNPRVVFTSYRNLLGIVFIFNGIFYFKNSKIKSYIFFILGILTHVSTFLIFLIFLISQARHKNLFFKIFFLATITIGVYLIYTRFGSYLLYFESKYFSYTEGRFSQYKGWKDFVLLSQILLRYFISWFVFIKVIHQRKLQINSYKIDISFYKYYLLIGLLSIPFRSIFLRYYSTAFLLFTPLIIEYISYHYISKRKKQLFLMTCMLSLVTHSWLYNFFTPASVGEGFLFSLFYPLKTIIEYKIHLPPIN